MIPEGWQKKMLSQCAAKITSGGTPKIGRDDYYGGNIPFLKIDDITSSNSLYLDSAKTTITEKAIEETSARLYPTGTVLVTMYGTIGEVGITSKEMSANQAIAAFLDLKDTNPEFLAYLLTNEAIQLANKSGRTTQANISGTILKTHEALIPPVPEQKKIAAILSSVDDAIQATQAVIDQSRRVKQGLLQQLLTHGIGHTRFKQTEIGEIPTDWKVSELAELCEKMTNGYVGPTKNIYTEKGIPYILCQNVRPNQFIKKIFKFVNHDFHSNNARSILKKGDVLTVQTGAGNGDTCVISDEFVGANCHALIISRTIKHLLDPDFLSNYLNSPHGKKRIDAIATGMAQPHLNTTDLRKFKIPVPTIEEQRKISENLKAFENSIFENQSYLGDLNKIKRGLMQDLLTGHVRVKLDGEYTT